MRTAFVLVPVLALAIAAGCTPPPDYSEAELQVKGSIGPYEDVDATGTFEMWHDYELNMDSYEGDVVVNDAGETVYVNVTVWHPDELPPGEAVHFSPNELTQVDGTLVELYACPNDLGAEEAEETGEEVQEEVSFSGSADDIISTRFKDGSLTLDAFALNPVQNLDLAIVMQRPQAAAPYSDEEL